MALKILWSRTKPITGKVEALAPRKPHLPLGPEINNRGTGETSHEKYRKKGAFQRHPDIRAFPGHWASHRGMHLPISCTDPISLSEKIWFLSL